MKTIWVPVRVAVLILGCFGTVGPGVECVQQETSDVRPDAYSFLDGVLKRYETAKTYHIELVEESQLNSDLRRSWDKRSMTAVVLPHKRYRFEVHFDIGWDVQISDGVSEWIYLPQLGQYTKGPAPASIPGPIPRVPGHALNPLLETRRMLGKLSAPRGWIRSATYLADERIEVNEQPLLCTVVQARGAVPGGAGANRKIDTTFKFWIDKKDEEIWKQTERREGPIFPDLPRVEYTWERTTWFKASKPDAQTAPDELFAFKPTEPVELVKEFVTPREKAVRAVEGKQVPEVTLGMRNGRTISRQSLQGNPVLLDFWATWCAPCVESLPALEKLYKETADKGLVFLSIDNDEEARTATEFLAKRKEPWVNFHLTDEIAAAFPEHGIPYLVLVDASGKIVYSWQGLDEEGLRAAVANLGPAFASVSKASQPLAKP